MIKQTIPINGFKAPAILSKLISLIENDENVKTLGIKQNTNPFQFPLNFEPIKRNFSTLNIAPPNFIKIEITRNINANSNYPEMFFKKF